MRVVAIVHRETLSQLAGSGSDNVIVAGVIIRITVEYLNANRTFFQMVD